MIKFGPSGHSESFFNEGNKSSIDMPAYISARGLDAFEYSFGRGVNISSATATAIGEEAKSHNIEISVHAPYYINFASSEQDKIKKSNGYILTSLKMLKCFGGKRCVFHSGSPLKNNREAAMATLMDSLRNLAVIVQENGYNDVYLCAETMGKLNQLGSVDEIIGVCGLSDMYIPCVDWGHINAREGGSIKTEEDYKNVITRFINGIGWERTKIMHMHYSHIEYGSKGEIRHLTNADTKYGPFFKPLLNVIHDMNLTPYIVSESAGTQAEDIAELKEYYISLKGNN